MASVPRLDGEAGRPLVPIEGQPPDLAALPPGCASRRAAAYVRGCRDDRPPLAAVGERHGACFLRDRCAAGRTRRPFGRDKILPSRISRCIPLTRASLSRPGRRR